MDRTSKRSRPRRFGTAIKDDEDGNHPQAVYAGCFECAGRDAARRTHAETENAFVKRTMTLLQCSSTSRSARSWASTTC